MIGTPTVPGVEVAGASGDTDLPRPGVAGCGKKKGRLAAEGLTGSQSRPCQAEPFRVRALPERVPVLREFGR